MSGKIHEHDLLITVYMAGLHDAIHSDDFGLEWHPNFKAGLAVFIDKVDLAVQSDDTDMASRWI